MGKRSKNNRAKIAGKRSVEEVQRDANRAMAASMLRQLGEIEDLSLHTTRIEESQVPKEK